MTTVKRKFTCVLCKVIGPCTVEINSPLFLVPIDYKKMLRCPFGGKNSKWTEIEK